MLFKKVLREKSFIFLLSFLYSFMSIISFHLSITVTVCAVWQETFFYVFRGVFRSSLRDLYTRCCFFLKLVVHCRRTFNIFFKIIFSSLYIILNVVQLLLGSRVIIISSLRNCFFSH